MRESLANQALNPDTDSPARGRFVGQSVKRVEDQRLLTGNGTYVADVSPEGVVHATFFRSPYAHAQILSIDLIAGLALDGVIAIYTGDDMERLTNPFAPLASLANQYTPVFYGLATDRVRHVGDPIAMIVAVSRAIAEDAAELIDVEYKPLATITNHREASDPSIPAIWPKNDGNVLYEDEKVYGEIERVFARADHVFTETFSCHRVSNQPMETRGAVAEIDPDSGEITYHAATQGPHLLRWMLAMSTERESALDSLKYLAGNRERLKMFGAGAKAFLTEKKDDLAKNDSTASVNQIKKDPRTLAHMGRAFINTLGSRRYPRVVAKDVGGAFGSKGVVNREDVVLLAAALDLNRSVKWIEDRSENLADGGQAREEDMTISVAAKRDGTILGFRVDLVMDQGAYPAVPFNCGLFANMIKAMLPGPYRLEAFEMKMKVVASNKGRYLQYRGPWANETWVRERMLDIVARELGISPTDLRQKNMFGPDDLPGKMITGPDLDEDMTAAATLAKAIEVADLPAFELAQAKALANGRHLGIGFATYHEAAPGPDNFWEAVNPGSDAFLPERVDAVLGRDGTVSIKTQQLPHGQSHETTYSQLAADELGIAIEDVTLIYGDTDNTPFGLLGTGGSRGGPVGGGGVTFSSRQLRELILHEAADLMEASVDDLDIVDGKIHVRGVPALSKSFADVAQAVIGRGQAASTANAIETHVVYSNAGNGGWACSTHVCWVDVDLETGFVTIPRYVVVEDCGQMINPAIVEGQIRGGVAQGIGAVFYEKTMYDDSANFQSSTFMDYLIPTAMEIPEIEIFHIETPASVEADFRGVGEGGMIGSPPAINNAVENALAHLGVRITEQHLPPTRILELAGVIEPE